MVSYNTTNIYIAYINYLMVTNRRQIKMKRITQNQRMYAVLTGKAPDGADLTGVRRFGDLSKILISRNEAKPLSIEEVSDTFNDRSYWETFQSNVDPNSVIVIETGLGQYATGNYVNDPSIELLLQHYYTFGASNVPFSSRTGLRVLRAGTSRVGTVTHGLIRSPQTYEEALFSSMLEQSKISTLRCGFDSGLRRVTKELYRQFTEKWK